MGVRGQSVSFEVDMVLEECCNCGVLFAMTKDFKDEKLKVSQRHNRRTFYCPNGHSQFYTGETEERSSSAEPRSSRKRSSANSRMRQRARGRKHETHRANGYKGHATRISKRVKHGVCICCNRTFADLAAHMATKHPQFTPQDSVEEP
jgi:hypothetical protein